MPMTEKKKKPVKEFFFFAISRLLWSSREEKFKDSFFLGFWDSFFLGFSALSEYCRDRIPTI